MTCFVISENTVLNCIGKRLSSAVIRCHVLPSVSTHNIVLLDSLFPSFLIAFIASKYSCDKLSLSAAVRVAPTPNLTSIIMYVILSKAIIG